MCFNQKLFFLLFYVFTFTVRGVNSCVWSKFVPTESTDEISDEENVGIYEGMYSVNCEHKRFTDFPALGFQDKIVSL